MRNEDRKLFALFNMSKNECIKVDTATMEQIKLEEIWILNPKFMHYQVE